MRFGEEIAKVIKGAGSTEGAKVAKARAVWKKFRPQIHLTEDEYLHPWKHGESLKAKLENVQELDLQEAYCSLIGNPYLTLHDRSDWRRTYMMMENAAMKLRLDPTGTRLPLEEAEVMSNMFQLLTQAKLYTTMMATYQLTRGMFEEFFATFNSSFERYKHQIPSDLPNVDHVPEGQDYKTDKLFDRWCQTHAVKFGKIIAVTRETIMTDRMGQVVDQCRGLGEKAKYREDQLAAYAFQDMSNKKAVIDDPDVEAGSYWPEAKRVPLYRTGAGSTMTAYEYTINKTATNVLTNWRSVESAAQLMLAMRNSKDDYIETMGNGGIRLVVPIGLVNIANILGASILTTVQVGTVSGALPSDVAATPTMDNSTEIIQMRAPMPLQNMGIPTVTVRMWKRLAGYSTQLRASDWYLAGDCKNQFKRHCRWEVEFNEATPAQMGGDDFNKDVIFKVRGGFNSGFNAVDDKYNIYCPGGQTADINT